MPAIRTERWINVYNSIKSSTSHSFELILIGPYALPPELANLKNVKYIKDFGSPMRCSNIGLILAEGELFTWGSDDGIYIPGAIDQAINEFYEMPSNEKNILIVKYTEGGNTFNDEYFRLNKAYPPVAHTNPDWWAINSGIFHTSYMKYMGGWDCRYETLALGHADFAIRAQRDGCITKISSSNIAHCDHMPGDSGDHAPIFHAHHEHDEPLFRDINNNDPTRTVININNWRQAPSVWARRFGG